MGHAVRVMTERNFDATLFSIERWQGSVPFCRLSSPFVPSLPDTWGEQADPLMAPFFQPRNSQHIERSETRDVGWGGNVCVPG